MILIRMIDKMNMIDHNGIPLIFFFSVVIVLALPLSLKITWGIILLSFPQ